MDQGVLLPTRQTKDLFTDDDAVSSGIGVILMLASIVILAAVIASLVLGFGDQPQQTPQTQFEFDYNNSDVEITHNGGETITAQEMEVRGDSDGGATMGQGWHNYNGGGNAESDISTGDNIWFQAGSGYDITVTYVPADGGNTAPLASDEGPDA
jgi:FlaG/FlaF family flagellin (archaellin)